MPSSVVEVFAAAGLRPAGVVGWGEPVPVGNPGVYVVALTKETARLSGAVSECPVSPDAVAELLRARPELRVDGARPTANALRARLSSLWLGDEAIVYIGLAGTSLRDRVSAYYKTPLGARRPHAGGWPLKTLRTLSELWLHYAPCADPESVELAMLDAFSAGVSAGTRVALHDPNLPIPFANLERTKGERQRHGITGAREPRTSTQSPRRRPAAPATPISAPAAARPMPAPGIERHARAESPRSTRHVGLLSHAGPMRSQKVSEKDLAAGRIRFPSPAKRAFPSQRGEVEVSLRGLQLTARWHPHYDSDQERSGVLSIGRNLLAEHVSDGEVLAVRVDAGRVLLS